MGDISDDKRSAGCGLFSAVFGRRRMKPRRSTSTGSLPHPNPTQVTRYPSVPPLRGSRSSCSYDSSVSSSPPQAKPDPRHFATIVVRSGQTLPRARAHQQQQQQQHGQLQQQQQQPQQLPKQKAHLPAPVRARSSQGHNQAPMAPPPALSLSGELESMIKDHQRTRGMYYGTLGNLRQCAKGYGAKQEEQPSSSSSVIIASSGKYPTSGMGNVVRKNDEKPSAQPGTLCRAVSTRMDPEQLNILGNEDYKNGRFAEAVALYDAAISVDPNKASYRGNKSAALVAMGKLLEAALECREAIRIDPYYLRAHSRLATIYVRLGEAEKALYHFKQSGLEADPNAIEGAKQIQIHLNKCTEAKRRRDFKSLLKETDLAIAAGADSAPLILGLKAEALVKMNRHEEAIQTLENGPNFDIDNITKFFGPIGSASLLLYHAQVDIVAGRLDDAMSAAQRASRLDLHNKELNTVLRRIKAVSTARSKGNDLFKSEKYSEACIAYGEGLNGDPYNALLLCNRAACRSKLGHHEKAIEDCNAALNVRAGYSKARLRRADCYAKMENWGACIQDCEVLIKENPDDEEAGKLLKEAKAKLNKHGGSQMLIGNGHAIGMVIVSSNERFRDYVTSPGTCVVLFCKKPGDGTIMRLIEKLIKKYPSVNFLKVEVEDNPSIAKSEGVNKLPAFIIYTNGSRTREISGENYELLETSIKYYDQY